jgi:hypothetical protein
MLPGAVRTIGVVTVLLGEVATIESFESAVGSPTVADGWPLYGQNPHKRNVIRATVSFQMTNIKPHSTALESGFQAPPDVTNSFV